MTELTPQQSKVAQEDAQRWWDSAHDRLRISVEYAQAGIKSLFLANGGGILALLTFAGNSGAIVEERALFFSFVWFGAGCFAALACYIAGYLSQSNIMQAEFLYSRQALSDSLNFDAEFDAGPYESRGQFIVQAGLVCSILSLGLFVAGALVGLDAIT